MITKLLRQALYPTLGLLLLGVLLVAFISQISSVGRESSSELSVRRESTGQPVPGAKLSQPDQAMQERLSEAYGKLPISFQVNHGQTDSQVRFLTHGRGYNLFLTPTEAVLSLSQPNQRIRSPQARKNAAAQTAQPHAVIRMRLVGGNPAPHVTGLDELPVKTNYFIGNDPAQWRSQSSYAKVKYQAVYPGVDLVYYGNQQQLEYDFVVAAGADAGVIRIAFEGTQRLTLDADGNLLLQTAGGVVRLSRPVIYQETIEGKKSVAGRHVILGRSEAGFEIGEYDRSKPLMIDPVLFYSTYLGGSRSDHGYGVAVDAAGYVYVTGQTSSNNFPLRNAYQTVFFSGGVSFVTKLNPSATGAASILYSTYFGSSGGGGSNAIAVDAFGNAYITGLAGDNLPLKNAYQTFQGGGDAFLAKLNTNTAGVASLRYATYLGGSASDEGSGITVDSTGNAYVVGNTSSNNFPTQNAYQTTRGSDLFIDAFVTKLDTNASGAASLRYSTYLGGDRSDQGWDIAAGAAGVVYVTGNSGSANFPLLNAYQTGLGSVGGTAAFVTKLDTSGLGAASLLYSTFLSGNSGTSGQSIAIDSAGNAYVTGNTLASNFPLKNAYQTYQGSRDVFVTKLNTNIAGAASLLYSTFLGGSSQDFGQGIAVDASGIAFVTGYSQSNNFPLKDQYQTYQGGGCPNCNDAFVAKLDTTASGATALLYATYLGGVGNDFGQGLAVDAAGNAYVAGRTNSPNFPTVNPWQATAGNTDGTYDAFVTKIAFPAPYSIVGCIPNVGGNTGTVTATIRGSGFAQGATVKLARAGQPDTAGNPVAVSQDGSTIGTTFNLNGREVGPWDVVVTNPGGSSVSLPGGFTVEGGSPEPWVDIVGRDAIRTGRAQTYTILYGNRGKTDAYVVPLWIGGIPKDATVSVDSPVKPPSPRPGQTPPDWSQLPRYIETDTEKLVPLILGAIPAGRSGSIKVTVTANTAQDFELEAWTNRPALSALQADALSNADCALSVVKEILTLAGLVPGVGCLESTVFYIQENYFDMAQDALESWRTGKSEDNLLSAILDSADIASLAARCLEKEIPWFVFYEIFKAIKGGIDVVQDCQGVFTPLEKKKLPVRVVMAADPNAKLGSYGSGTAKYLSGAEPLRYAIYFENVQTATAAAQEVLISDQLDTTKLDMATLSLGPIAFGTRLINPPSGVSEFTTDVDLRPANDLIVRITARLDKVTGVLTWHFISLDPATGLLTQDPLAGFLPPNLNPPEGDGSVVFTVNPQAGLATGTEIRNQARIIFDTNSPIDTPEWLNTLDNDKPASQVLPLAASQCPGFEVQWAGADAGSGVQNYTIWVSDNGGAFIPWQSLTTQTQAVFMGLAGHTYAFYSVAQDNAGNFEEAPAAAVVTVTVNAALMLSGTSQSFTPSGGSGSVGVIAPSGCVQGWTATSNAGWITITSGSNGSGNGTVQFSVASNPGTQRTGTMTIAGQTFTVTQDSGCGVITLGPVILFNGTAGASYNQTITASGGTPSYSFMLMSGTLPADLSLSANGTLSGTPSAAGIFNFIVTATDANGCTGMQSYSITITTRPMIGALAVSQQQGSFASNPQIATASDVEDAGEILQVQLSVDGMSFGNAATLNGVTVTLTDSNAGATGSNPNSMGRVFADVVAACGASNASFMLTVTDSSGAMETAMLVVTVNANTAPILTYANPQSVTVNGSLNVSPTTASDNGMITGYMVLGGHGLTTPPAVDASGMVSINNAQPPGNHDITIRATDNCGSFTDAAFTLLVSQSGPANTSTTMASSVNPSAFGQSVMFTATVAPDSAGTGVPTGSVTFSIDGGAPQTMTLAGGKATFTTSTLTVGGHSVQATYLGNAQFNTSSGMLSGGQTVNCPAVSLTPATLPNGQAGMPYSQPLAAQPSGGNYTYAVTNGALPQGLSLDPGSGVISGTPAQTGSFSFRVTANGFGTSCSGSRDYQMSVPTCTPVTVNPTDLPGGTAGTAYSQMVSGSPNGTYSYSVTSGVLPPGLTLNAASGAITGAPSQTGSFAFTITAATGSCSGARGFSVTIGCPAITLAAPNSATAGASFSGSVAASPSGTYTYSIQTGSLPSGLTLNTSTGEITGLPAIPGTYSFAIKAQAANGCSGSQSYSLVVGCPNIAVNPSSLPSGAIGTTYNQTFTASPAGGNYAYSISGTLPAGLNLNPSTGVLSGTPTANGSFIFTITATGWGGCTGGKTYTVTVSGGGGCPTITLPGSLPNGSVGQLYNNSVAASPSGSYSYLATGNLPPGVTLYNSNGLIFGYPTAAGSYTFTITATAGACSGSQTYTVLIGAGFAASLTVFSDFDGDGKSDLSVWRGSDGNWLVAASGDGQVRTTSWGASYTPYNDVTVSGDYDGDGKTDLAVFRRGGAQAGYWYIKQSSDGQVKSHFWGLGADVPVPGDYDGDGKTDIAVWRGSEGTWYISRSSDGTTSGITWGAASVGDIPVPGDYDGDGSTDVAVFRQSTGDWYIKRSSDGQTISKLWGVGTDVPAPGDYDGDGKTDIAVWRGSDTNWYIVQSSTNAIKLVSWGTASLGDVAVPGDYDGDGKADVAVWRESTGAWYVKRSGDDAVMSKSHGQSGDVPIMARRN